MRIRRPPRPSALPASPPVAPAVMAPGVAAGSVGDGGDRDGFDGRGAGPISAGPTRRSSPAHAVAPIALPLKVGSAHEVTPLVGPGAVNGAIRTLIASAKRELVVMVHAISDPAAAALIAERAKAGVQVTVVRNDPQAQVGVRSSRVDAEQALLDELGTAGVRVVVVPMEQLARRTALSMPHDHRKLIIADHARAYVGGANPRTHLDNFDTGVILDGPVVKQLARQAAIDIASYTGEAAPLPRAVDHADGGVLQVLSTNTPGQDPKSAILAAIASAKHRITIANQEIDDDDVMEALIRRKAEVPTLQVSVLIGPRKLEKTMAGFALALPMNTRALEKLPAAGIDVFSATNRLERGGIMHAKLMVVDGTTTIVGSSDLNRRSFGGNVELDLRLKSASVGAAFEQGVLDELKQSERVTPTTLRERLVSRSVGSVRSALVSFGRSRRLVRRMGFGFSPAGRRILNRQKLGNAGPPVHAAPRTVAEARHHLLDALQTTSLRPPAPRTLSTTLQPGERLLYVGVPPEKADLVARGIFSPAVNANFGGGMYLASDAHTAIDYAQVRSSGQVGNGSVFVVALTADRVFELPAGRAALEAWVASQPAPPTNPLLMMPHYCRAHGFDAAVVKDAEGPGRDYVVVYDEHRLRPVLRQDLGGPWLTG